MTREEKIEIAIAALENPDLNWEEKADGALVALSLPDDPASTSPGDPRVWTKEKRKALDEIAAVAQGIDGAGYAVHARTIYRALDVLKGAK